MVDIDNKTIKFYCDRDKRTDRHQYRLTWVGIKRFIDHAGTYSEANGGYGFNDNSNLK